MWHYNSIMCGINLYLCWYFLFIYTYFRVWFWPLSEPVCRKLQSMQWERAMGICLNKRRGAPKTWVITRHQCDCMFQQPHKPSSRSNDHVVTLKTIVQPQEHMIRSVFVWMFFLQLSFLFSRLCALSLTQHKGVNFKFELCWYSKYCWSLWSCWWHIILWNTPCGTMKWLYYIYVSSLLSFEWR